MDAFGKGIYIVIDTYNIIATFGGREHYIHFNNDFTSFSSKRKYDLQVVNGTIII